MPLKITQKSVEALLIALKESERIKPSQVVKREVFRSYGILGTATDRVFTAIFYGLMRKLGIVDEIICRALGIDSVSDLDPFLRASLRFSTYVIHFGRMEPEIERIVNHFIPKVLKRLVDESTASTYINYLEKIRKFKYIPENEVKELELKYSIPSWLIEKVKEVLRDSNEVEEFLQAVNRPPLMSFRVNTLKATVEEVIEELRREGKDPVISKYVPTVVKFRGPYDYEKSKLLSEGKVVPQDDASAMASLVLNPEPGEIVVDMCAAPGGKTTHLAEIMKNKGKIYAFDIYDDRIERLKLMVNRTGVTIVEIFKEDARKAPEILGEEVADKVLLDPPCSTTGAIAKHPEARWRLNMEKLSKIIELQRELLETAIRLVKPGGRILYTVCSILREECEGNVEYVLSKYGEFIRLVPIKGPFSEGLMPGTMRAWPHRHGTTGFFYALFEKIKSLGTD